MTRQTVHLRVNDAASGRPTPCRLLIRDRLGTAYAPFGRTSRHGPVAIDGTCEIELPTGDLLVEIDKGPDFVPIRLAQSLPPGKMALRFQLQRRSERRPGWTSADCRAHGLSPHTAWLEAAAAGLDLVQLLAREQTVADGEPVGDENLLAFSGQNDSVSRDGTRVVVNTFNRHEELGALSLLHCHRVVFPLGFGGPSRTDDWSLADWCDQCHRKGGLTIWADPGTEAFPGGEALANAVAGRIDAIECPATTGLGLDMWYLLLSSGLRMPIVGSSAVGGPGSRIGSRRTLAFLGEPGDEPNRGWVSAIKRGRCHVLADDRIPYRPVLSINERECEPGDVLESDGGGLRVTADLPGGESSYETQLIVNGEVVSSGARIDGGVWVAVRQIDPADGRTIRFHSSPVYVRSHDRPTPISREAIARLQEWLRTGEEWVDTHGRFQKAKSREHLREMFAEAQQILHRNRDAGFSAG